MTKRLLSFLLAVVTVISALLLASCGKESGNDDSNDSTASKNTAATDIDTYEEYIETYAPEETADTYTDVEVTEKYDFGGHEFKFLNSDDIYYMYRYLDPEQTGDVLDDCCYERNFLAEQYFNITITEETQPYDELSSYAKTLILTGEDVYDAMYLPPDKLTALISENLFYDLLEIDELNIDKIWWDQPLITRNTLEGRLFYATSDLHLMAFEGTWAMYFNEDMMIELGLDLPYQLAMDGKWTFDELKRYTSAAANLNGDNSFTYDIDGKATYGLVAHDYNLVTWGYGMGAEAVSRDENGRYYFSADTDPKFTDVYTNLISFAGPNDGNYVVGEGSDYDSKGYFSIFQANRALFIRAELKGATMLREWEGNFGLMPVPKYDENQENYNSYLGALLAFCIPNTNTNLERTGVIVDYLTYMSYASLVPRYYDIHVSLKALGKQESIDVLSIIRSSRGIPAESPFGWNCGLYADGGIWTLCETNTLALASTIEKFRNSIISAIETTYNDYPTLNSVNDQ